MDACYFYVKINTSYNSISMGSMDTKIHLVFELIYCQASHFLGNVIDNSQVDTVGKQFWSVNLIFGTDSNPVAGILDDPVKKYSTSPTHVSSLSAQSEMYSYHEKTMLSSCVRLFEPLKEYCTTNESQRNLGVISYILEAASNPHTSFCVVTHQVFKLECFQKTLSHLFQLCKWRIENKVQPNTTNQHLLVFQSD